MSNSISFSDLISYKDGDKQVILDPFLKKPELTLLYAERGLGKTWLCLNLAYSLATGTAFGNFTPQEKQKVFYIDGEIGKGTLSKRLSGIFNRYAKTPEDGYLQFLTQEETGGMMWNLSTVEGKTKIWSLIKDMDVIIIDNLMTCTMRQDQFDNPIRIWERMQTWLVNLRTRGKTVILIHHTNKMGDQAGTKDKENINDNVIALNRCKTEPLHKGAKFVLSFEKTRNLAETPADTVWLLKSQGRALEWEVKAIKDSQRDYIRHLQGLNWKDGDIAKHLEISKSYLNELLDGDTRDLPAIRKKETKQVALADDWF